MGIKTYNPYQGDYHIYSGEIPDRIPQEARGTQRAGKDHGETPWRRMQKKVQNH